MDNLPTKDEMIAFEEDIAETYNSGKIRAPVHSYNGNEEQMRAVFQHVRPQDWVFATWRSHYQCLLKGVPPEKLKEKIVKGYSISLCFKDYNIVSSAIVGGIIPIALGVAMSIKQKGENSMCYCFVGDMTSTTGIFAECYTYAKTHDLPIKWVIEDNEQSVYTDTKKVWGLKELPAAVLKDDPSIIYYTYKNKWPHYGYGKRVEF